MLFQIAEYVYKCITKYHNLEIWAIDIRIDNMNRLESNNSIKLFESNNKFIYAIIVLSLHDINVSGIIIAT